ncbi:RING-H2 finger protein ATL51 [Abeliophyllum distichum]|uniref:RING-type E3 ubiquitin transferase n=1 Tax=Abeliophyllum distichum TaxID=126358 RepID=A0ABD1V8B6_9LAMI
MHRRQEFTGTFFTPLLISMLGIVATSLAIIVYHFVVVKYCLRRQRTTTTTEEGQPVPEAIPTGVDEKVLETIPVMAYSSLKKRNVDQSECAICLGEMEDEDLVRLLPKCKHAFHFPCIDQWLVAHINCPVCRSAIVAVEEEEEDDKTAIIVPLPAIENIRNNGISSGIYHVHESTSTTENASSSGGQSFALLRHCYSMILPMERRSSSSSSLASRGSIMELKRSLSMDQSYVVVVNIEGETERGCSSPSSLRAELTRSRSYRTSALSLRHFDRISSKLLSSFSRLRVEKRNGILPY